MESFSELIKARRSMRKFTEEELTQEQVVTLMKAALMSPSSKRSNMIQLQAEDLGLGSCWVQVRERFTASGMPSGEYVHEVLDIPLQLQVLSVIAIGHKGM